MGRRLAPLLVLLALAGVSACGSDEPSGAVVGSGAFQTAASSTVRSTTTSTTTTTTSRSAPDVPHVWPAPGAAAFPTPEDAARSFAADYLGMREARLGATGADGVEVFPNAAASARTLVTYASMGDGFVVTGARADEIVVDTPATGSAIERPTTTVSGRSTAFEAQLDLQFRSPGSTEALTRSTAMGGANGEVAPFTGTIPTPDGSPVVLVVAEGDASGRGTSTKATVVLLGG